MFNDSLNKEEINTKKLSEAQGILVRELLKTARAKAAVSQIEKLSEKLVLLQSGVENVGTSFSENLFIYLKNFGDLSAAAEIAKKGFINTQIEIKETQAQIEALSKIAPEDQLRTVTTKTEVEKTFTPKVEGAKVDLTPLQELEKKFIEIDTLVKNGFLSSLDAVDKKIDEIDKAAEATHSRTSRNPGSDIPGVPASEINAMFLPCCK